MFTGMLGHRWMLDQKESISSGGFKIEMREGRIKENHGGGKFNYDIL
jgi:hypothetical protein